MAKSPNVGVQLSGTGLPRVVFKSGFSQSGESLRNDMLDWLLGGGVLARLSFWSTGNHGRIPCYTRGHRTVDSGKGWDAMTPRTTGKDKEYSTCASLSY